MSDEKHAPIICPYCGKIQLKIKLGVGVYGRQTHYCECEMCGDLFLLIINVKRVEIDIGTLFYKKKEVKKT